MGGVGWLMEPCGGTQLTIFRRKNLVILALCVEIVKASPLLLIGLVLFLWGRGMTHEDYVMMGLGKNGHLELRSAAAAVSLSGSQGLHKLGKWFSFEFNSRQIAAEASAHKGFKARFDAPMNWELRIPLLGVMVMVIFALVFLMKWFKPR